MMKKIGIGIGKKKYDVCVVDRRGKVLHQDTYEYSSRCKKVCPRDGKQIWQMPCCL